MWPPGVQGACCKRQCWWFPRTEERVTFNGPLAVLVLSASGALDLYGGEGTMVLQRPTPSGTPEALGNAAPFPEVPR